MISAVLSINHKLFCKTLIQIRSFLFLELNALQYSLDNLPTTDEFKDIY